LLTTFTHLQLKLAAAKKQLAPSTSNSLCEFSLELNSCAEEVLGADNGLPGIFFDKTEESTINLESNQRLISAVRSKERLIWTNKIKTYYLKEVARGIIGLN
jgi:hypothetical protein